MKVRASDIFGALDTGGHHLNGSNGAQDSAGRVRRERRAGANPRWWGVLCEFVGHHLSSVTPAAGVVWLVLFRNSYDGMSRMSIDQICLATGISRRHVIRSVNSLVEAGLVTRMFRGSRNSGSTIYRIREKVIKGAIDGTIRPVVNVPPAAHCNVPPAAHSPRQEGDAPPLTRRRSLRHEKRT